MPSRTRRIAHLALLALGLIPLVLTQHALAAQDQPVVRAVLFYSPSCGHCEMVITEALPPLIETYGDQLQIVGINVAMTGGQALYLAAIERFSVPDDRLGVPMVIVGEIVLVGSREIPEQFPAIIEEGLRQGGIDWPDIPGLPEALAAASLATEAPDSTSTVEASPSSATLATSTPSALPTLSTAFPTETAPTAVDRFLNDPLGNSLSVVVLMGMIASLVVAGMHWVQPPPDRPATWKVWAVPLLSIAGALVALYLTYVETTGDTAVCGPVGDCNAVQQSPYAKVFGVLPVGLLGLAGYILILASWLATRRLTGRARDWGDVSLLALTLFGTVFSLVLTFLEPFVIGATCSWCLSSAIFMTALMLLAADPGIHALGRLQGDE
jgi:uncharacterized membrane protein/thiol-disulfide isomerase/thioredoxin